MSTFSYLRTSYAFSVSLWTNKKEAEVGPFIKNKHPQKLNKST